MPTSTQHGLFDEDDVWFDALETFSDDDEESPAPNPTLDENEALASQFPLHRAAFDNDRDFLSQQLPLLTPEQLQARDPHGNTILHVAAMRCSIDAARAILEAGLPVSVKNARGWLPVEEAADVGDVEMARMLLQADFAGMKATMKQKKALLLSTMAELPDYCMQLKWELGSSVPGVGMLLRKYAPHDVYTIWKCGQKIRVDGSLMGLDSKSQSVVPQWKRGHFSLLFDGSEAKSRVVFLNRGKKTYVDVQAEKKGQRLGTQGADDPRLAALVQEMVEQGVKRTKWTTTGFTFKPVRGWLGGEMTEKVEGWQTKVYEATGHMCAIHKVKTPYDLPASATFNDYLTAIFPEDIDMEMPITGMPTGGAPGPPYFPDTPPAAHTPNGKPAPAPSASTSQPATDTKKGRKVTGRCWMAKDFPMSLQQLLPLLELVGQANKHIGKVAKFMSKYGSLQMFPVKVQVPLMFTLYLLLGFQRFRRLEDEAELGEGFFQVPEGFQKVSLQEVMEKAAAKYEKQGSLQGGPGDRHLVLSDDDLALLEEEGLDANGDWGAQLDERGGSLTGRLKKGR